MSNALQAIPTDHGLDVLTSTLKNSATTYVLMGALTHDATETSEFYRSTIETAYYDENGVLTFVLELPVEQHFDEYLHQIHILDTGALGEEGKSVIECATSKIALGKGIGGMVILKASVSGQAGEVVFKSSEFVTETELNELFLAPIYKELGERIVGENLLINGDFSVWQRGESFTISYGHHYAADRWLARGTISKITSKALCGLRISGSGNYTSIRQRVEVGYKYASNTVTLSFVANNVVTTDESTITYKLQSGSYVNAPYTIKNGFNSFSFELTGDGDIGDFLEVSIQFKGADEAAVSMEVFNVKLEAGAIATPFIPDHPSINLAKCQCYFRKGVRFSRANYEVMESREERIRLSPHMRATPAIINVTGLQGHNSLTAHSGGVSIYAGGGILSSQISENVVCDLDAEI